VQADIYQRETLARQAYPQTEDEEHRNRFQASRLTFIPAATLLSAFAADADLTMQVVRR
jgi:hypothetical protein